MTIDTTNWPKEAVDEFGKACDTIYSLRSRLRTLQKDIAYKIQCAVLEERERRAGECKVESLSMYECPDCAFSFDSVHIDANGEYSCPNCYEEAAGKVVNLAIEALENCYGPPEGNVARALAALRGLK